MSGAGQSSNVRTVPEADIVNGMMYKAMEKRLSIHILIHSGNIIFTSPIMEALLYILTSPLSLPLWQGDS